LQCFVPVGSKNRTLIHKKSSGCAGGFPKFDLLLFPRPAASAAILLKMQSDFGLSVFFGAVEIGGVCPYQLLEVGRWE
jgi:hypothetical protein